MFKTLKSHFDTTLESLKLIKQSEASKTRYDNTAFLPAALDILETPPNPLGRGVVWVIVSFLMIALIWSIVGSVDIVAIGEGKIIPRGQVKVIQSADLGVVRELHVKEGQAVKAGDALIVLDPTVSGAEVQQAQQALLTAQLELAQSRALADFVAGRPAHYEAPVGADLTASAVQSAYLQQRIDEQRSTLSGLNEARVQRASESRMNIEEGRKLSQQLPLLEERLRDLQSLHEQGLAPKTVVNEAHERAIGMRQDILIRREEGHKAQAAALAANQAYISQRSKFASDALKALTEAEANYRLREEELKKTREKARLTVLRAPVDGYAQQLQLHTVGGVVKAADPLLVIVPKGAELLVEASFPNREVGFLRAGQLVEVKLEAFPFTRYGTLTGRLEQISRDAINDEKRGLLYTAIVAVDAPAQQQSGGKSHQIQPSMIQPGMAASVEIKTGRRSIISYLLSPLSRRVSEAGRER
ncbi:HlyD family type I secretion periplasmic adaptor subunit [Asticcacaulis benevestitus]|uniref:Membrane fusion protein (MFP) family protein n=1 Tax=Asticcacaulis benevestitus DSM 16100 = ATCC BAA-896 TaxID=1121022 RepID=V4PYT9_9CAUL|nr:HlyD family type I secretion periplasmic adaptor subunit [Asticcacaulis benevestitus]ESQ92569.1 hypothetical protein ABENE_07990 [Asticcacaulis benevestitus DSM 16100 = ATCC BAA-896]